MQTATTEANATTPVRTLASLEEAICEYIEKFSSGELNPWSHRLTDRQRSQAIPRLAKRLGPRYWRCTLSNFEQYDNERQAEALANLRSFAESMPDRLSDGSGLVLLGRPGTGKDHLMAALLKIAVAKHSLSADWWDGGSLYDAITQSVNGDTWPQLFDRLTGAQILAISDPVPPRGDLTDPQLRRMRDVVDARYRQTLSTWITTNLDSRKQAAERLTMPVLERITERSVQVFCDWESYRSRSTQHESNSQ